MGPRCTCAVLLPLLLGLSACSEGAWAAALSRLATQPGGGLGATTGARPGSPKPATMPSPGLPTLQRPSWAPEGVGGPGPMAPDAPPLAWPSVGVAAGLPGQVGAVGSATQPWPSGDSTDRVQVGPELLTLHLHKPASYRGERLLVVFHGVNRDAEAYRDRAKELAERTGALVVAPLFDEARFPYERYQGGGILRGGVAVAPQERTGALVQALVAEVARREGRLGMAHAFIGHSGGAQALGRIAAFLPSQAQRIVLANPGSYTFPTEAADFPYGLGGLPASLRQASGLQAWLAQPLSLYLGDQDLLADENLDQSPPAMAQGTHRFARGQAAFASAQALALAQGWAFGWRMVVAEGVGHSSSRMFNHARCAEALGW